MQRGLLAHLRLISRPAAGNPCPRQLSCSGLLAMLTADLLGQAAQSRSLAAKVLRELSRDPAAGKKVADLLREGDGVALKAVVAMLNNKEDMEGCAAAASLISALPQNDSKLNHLLVQVPSLLHPWPGRAKPCLHERHVSSASLLRRREVVAPVPDQTCEQHLLMAGLCLCRTMR